jgi:hypothetical protein
MYIFWYLIKWKKLVSKYKQVRMLNKGSGNTRPWFVLSVKLNSTAPWCKYVHLFRFSDVPLQSFVVVFVLFVVVCVRCACRNRFIQFHAEVILFPASTAYLYFLSLISTFLSFEVVSHRQVFR